MPAALPTTARELMNLVGEELCVLPLSDGTPKAVVLFGSRRGVCLLTRTVLMLQSDLTPQLDALVRAGAYYLLDAKAIVRTPEGDVITWDNAMRRASSDVAPFANPAVGGLLGIFPSTQLPAATMLWVSGLKDPGLSAHLVPRYQKANIYQFEKSTMDGLYDQIEGVMESASDARFDELQRELPWPARWPFRQLFIAWNGTMHVARRERGVERKVRVNGIFVTDTGDVYLHTAEYIGPPNIALTDPRVGRVSDLMRVEFIPLRTAEGGWTRPDTLAWIVVGIVNYLAEAPRVVSGEPLSRTGERAITSQLKKLRQPMHRPPPFYPIRLDLETFRVPHLPERAPDEDVAVVRDYTHRWQVAGYTRCYIRQGPLPLDEKMEKKLRARCNDEGVPTRVYRYGDPISIADQTRLKKRGITVKPGQWLSILDTWVDDHTAGPADKPLIPATRVVQMPY